jgi:hypothetical protein
MAKKRKVPERTRCEIWSRSVGYLRPVEQWNVGKQEEFKDRVTFKVGSEHETLDIDDKG